MSSPAPPAARVAEKQERLAKVFDSDVWPLYGRRFPQLLLRELDLRPAAATLEIGCATGELTLELARRLDEASQITALELSAPLAARAQAKIAATPRTRRRVSIVQTATPLHPTLVLPDSTYDICVSNLGLADAPEPERTVAELANMLKPGGELVLTVPLRGTWGELLDIYRDVLRDDRRTEALAALDAYVAGVSRGRHLRALARTGRALQRRDRGRSVGGPVPERARILLRAADQSGPAVALEADRRARRRDAGHLLLREAGDRHLLRGPRLLGDDRRRLGQRLEEDRDAMSEEPAKGLPAAGDRARYATLVRELGEHDRRYYVELAPTHPRRRVRPPVPRAARPRGGAPRLDRSRLADPARGADADLGVPQGRARRADAVARQHLQPGRAAGVLRSRDQGPARRDAALHGRAEDRRHQHRAAVLERALRPGRDPRRRPRRRGHHGQPAHAALAAADARRAGDHHRARRGLHGQARLRRDQRGARAGRRGAVEERAQLHRRLAQAARPARVRAAAAEGAALRAGRPASRFARCTRRACSWLRALGFPTSPDVALADDGEALAAAVAAGPTARTSCRTRPTGWSSRSTRSRSGGCSGSPRSFRAGRSRTSSPPTRRRRALLRHRDQRRPHRRGHAGRRAGSGRAVGHDGQARVAVQLGRGAAARRAHRRPGRRREGGRDHPAGHRGAGRAAHRRRDRDRRSPSAARAARRRWCGARARSRCAARTALPDATLARAAIFLRPRRHEHRRHRRGAGRGAGAQGHRDRRRGSVRPDRREAARARRPHGAEVGREPDRGDRRAKETATLSRLLIGLGIPHVGVVAARAVAARFGSFEHCWPRRRPRARRSWRPRSRPSTASAR